MSRGAAVEIPVIESPYVRAGQPILVGEGAALQVIAHPLDVLLISRPELSPVERVMVLVDRVVERALRRLEP